MRAFDEKYVIWSFEHDAWWGPGEMGYTPHLLKAGLYTKARADQIVARANIVRVNERALTLAEALESGAPDPPTS